MDRPNLFIKIPAARQGLPAIAACLGEGISINVTLIFSLTRYDEVLDAFLDGLEQAQRAGLDLARDRRRWPRSSSPGSTPRSTRDWTRSAPPKRPSCAGRRRSPTPGWPISTTNGCWPAPRWQALAAAGARPQRPLWASTSTKDPAYPDTRYVVDLVAPNVVNTMPEATLHAVADHGQVPADSVRAHYAESQQALDGLDALGISYRDVVRTLEDDAVAKFDGAWEQLAERVTNTLRAQPSSAPAPADDRRPTRAAPTRDGRR